MEQIYYTQCPIGYGLGASNGFQVKRITRDYPQASDFRHLALRAFPGGGRVLAPPTLRYRRDEERAEVAWLSPRAFEYETERGLWGRPGGHFAHGLLLDPLELSAIENWPAGLFESAIWRRSDTTPSRGQPPDEVLLDPSSLRTHKLSEIVNELACDLNQESIAQILMALAIVTGEGRTLFLIDDAERLGPRIAALTWLFPPVMRLDLTFSTFHDRPEELPGFRLQGTIASARPNCPQLLNQGMIADIKTRKIEPMVEVMPWAQRMAEWIVQKSFASLQRFSNHLQKSASLDAEKRWDLERLNQTVLFGDMLDASAAGVDWSQVFSSVSWASTVKLGDEWAATHGPSWWLAGDNSTSDTQRTLLAIATWPATWQQGSAGGWGRVVAKYFGASSARDTGVLTFVKHAPSDTTRLEFLRALRTTLPTENWSHVRATLEKALPVNSRLVAALAISDAVAIASKNPEPLRAFVERFHSPDESALFLLGLLKEEVEGRRELIEIVSPSIKSLFEHGKTFQWAIRQEASSIDWLKPFLQETLASPDQSVQWAGWLRQTSHELRPKLAEVLTQAASCVEACPEALLWSVEHVLMAVDVAGRPYNPALPGLYLDRSGSDLELLRKISGQGQAAKSLRSWIVDAKKQSLLDANHIMRLAQLNAIAQTIDTKSEGSFDPIDFSKIPGLDRGPLLSRWLSNPKTDFAKLFQAISQSWGPSFAADSPDLAGIADAISKNDHLLSCLNDPGTWFHRLTDLSQNLSPLAHDDVGLGPRGLVAQVVARTVRNSDRREINWGILTHLHNNEAGWKTLTELLRWDLAGQDAAGSLGVVDRWYKSLSRIDLARFWEVVLNASDGPRLATLIPQFAKEYLTLPVMSWWAFTMYEAATNDVREAFARLAPMGPIEEVHLSYVQNWMKGWQGSDAGKARWIWIDRLSKGLFRASDRDEHRGLNVFNWRTLPDYPLRALPLDDRYQILAWIVYRIEDGSRIQLAPLAKWLLVSGVTEPERLQNWRDELAGLVEVSSVEVRDRSSFVRELRREIGQVIEETHR
jgi:hypothetical protein